MDKPTGKRKFKIHQEDVKLRHTPHWDADYMSREEFEAYMNGETVCQVKRDAAARAGTETGGGESPAPEPSLWERFLRACLPDR